MTLDVYFLQPDSLVCPESPGVINVTHDHSYLHVSTFIHVPTDSSLHTYLLLPLFSVPPSMGDFPCPSLMSCFFLSLFSFNQYVLTSF